MKKTLTLILLVFMTTLNAQIASMDAFVINDGKDGDYRKIEEFVAPLKAMAIKEGNLMQWVVMKRKAGGDLTSIDKSKEIANYVVFNVYKSKSQMESDNWSNYKKYAEKVYKRKMSKSSIAKMFKMAEGTEVKKSWRQYTIEGIYQTPTYRAQVGDIINLSPMEALNEDYEKFEMEYFMPNWQKVINSGGLRMWGLTKVVSSNDNAFKNLTHFVFQNKTGAEIIYEEESFLDSKLLELGMESRKMYDSAELEIIYLEN